MRYRLIVLLFAAFFCLPAAALPKYFGYFNNNSTPPEVSYQPDNQDHTNITHVYTGGDIAGVDWDDTILREAALAKSYGNKAIVTVTSHLFQTPPGGQGQYYADPEAASKFSRLVDRLVAGGYLVPQDPEASTVVAFYPVDEPDFKKWLDDIGGNPHPALANAVNVIKSDWRTSNFPVAVVVSQDYGRVIQGMRLFDWVGMDNYGSSDDGYAISMLSLRTHLRPEQRTIWVPQAATGSAMPDGSVHSPTNVYESMLKDPQAIMLMPFLWSHVSPTFTGVRDIPWVRAQYLPIGYQIKQGLYGQYLGGQVYGEMVTGGWYNLVLYFRNISDKTWPVGTGFALGSQSPRDNTTWGTHRVALPYSVGPGQDVAFNFWVQAPAWAGTYAMQWQLVRDGYSWFAGATPAWNIAVIPPPTGSISANRNPCTIPYGGSTCTTTLSWNSNRADAEVWASNLDGSSPVLFARAQNGSQSATWITTNGTRFTLKSGGTAITQVDVYGVQTTQPPEEPPPHCSTPKCIEP